VFARGNWAATGRRLAGWIPTGGGLRHEDWTRRHRLLTLVLAASMVLLTTYGALRHGLDAAWVTAVLLILPCVLAAVLLPGRRLPATAVALGYVVACADFVAMCDGRTEAHFTFFIAVAALALYRDWAPFGVLLAAVVLDHAVFGTLFSNETYDHHAAMTHPLEWALLHGAAVLAAAGFQVIAWSLTEAEERRAQDNLAESRAQLSIAFDETPVPMAMIAPDGRFLRTNAAYRNWLRLPDVLPDGYRVSDLPITPEPDRRSSFFDELARQEGTVTFTRQYRRDDDGSMIFVEVHSSALRDRKGRLGLIFVQCLDLTDRQQHQAELQRQVRHDALTGLLSRSAFEQDLAATLAAGPEPASVIYLDVDRFKSINDGSGHGAGDETLRALATRLRGAVPAEALLARLGGDEFVVALPGAFAAGLDVGRAILASFAAPLPVGGADLQLSVSMGIAAAAGPHEAEPAVLAADTAMYAAKRAGGNRLEIFSDQMRVSVRERIVAESRLRHALDGDRDTTLPVWFQPIVSPAGRILGAEALVRMRTPDGVLHGPGHFIGVAEETGLVVPLGEHVLATALDHLLRWRLELGYVSVNVSPRQLSEPGFVPMLARLLAISGLDDPSRLVLEITETAMLATSVDLRARLSAIKDLGVRIALDDFGTGYSSLTWLQSVPADVVKLDRSFVAGLSREPRKASIITAVLWLARSLNMSVVAEGVEDADDWDALGTADCPAIQGYYFSPPAPPAEFQRLLLGPAALEPAGHR
jgi:diguanylate cyclase (GGDEF)-like protein/PAS domain S-box-containing protein